LQVARHRASIPPDPCLGRGLSPTTLYAVEYSTDFRAPSAPAHPAFNVIEADAFNPTQRWVEERMVRFVVLRRPLLNFLVQWGASPISKASAARIPWHGRSC